MSPRSASGTRRGDAGVRDLGDDHETKRLHQLESIDAGEADESGAIAAMISETIRQSSSAIVRLYVTSSKNPTSRISA